MPVKFAAIRVHTLGNANQRLRIMTTFIDIPFETNSPNSADVFLQPRREGGVQDGALHIWNIEHVRLDVR